LYCFNVLMLMFQSIQIIWSVNIKLVTEFTEICRRWKLHFVIGRILENLTKLGL
jgi:hypothetical protein